MRGRGVLLAGTICVALALGAAPALADHHLIKIREVYPGNTAHPVDEFVEVQMYANGQQNLDYGDLSGASLEIFGADGNPNVEFFPNDVSFGNSQRTVLFGETMAEFGVNTDFGYNTDEIDPAGGAVCFNSTVFPSPIDCVAWGSITNPPGSAGTPEPGAVPNGSSLVRSIARRCPTLLEAADDTNTSSADLSLDATPTPRANSAIPTERACPNTRITRKPPKETTKRRARFRFTATQGADEFKCKLDSRPFRSCSSPYRKRVGLGRHIFKVKAQGDATPARYSWKRVRPD